MHISDDFQPPPSDHIDRFAIDKAMCWQFLRHASLPDCPRLAWAAGHAIRLVRRMRKPDSSRMITLDERNDWLELTLPIHDNLVDRMRIPVDTIRRGIHGLQSEIDELAFPLVPYRERHAFDLQLALDGHDRAKALEYLLLANGLIAGAVERQREYEWEYLGIAAAGLLPERPG